MKKIFTIIILILVFLNPVFALTADVKILKNSIYMDENAVFLITLKNPTNLEKNVKIYSTDISFISETEPSIIYVPANSELNVTLKLYPNSWSSFGAKGVDIMVSSFEDNIEFTVPIYIKTFEMIEKKYSPSVELKIDFFNEIDPRKEYPLTLNLRNRNKLDIKNMNIMIRSKNFNYDINDLSLEPFPNGELKQTIRFYLDRYTIPQEDQLEVILFYENKSFNRLKYNYKIIDYSDLVIKEEKAEELFKKKIDYYIKNEGNVKKIDKFKYPTNFFKNFFIKTSIPYSKTKINKEYYLEWNIELEPLEETHINIVENYRPIIYFVLILLFGILIYYIYRSQVIVKKEAIITGKNNEGISTMKVLIHLRNRTQDLIENIEIKDVLPSIVEYIDEERHGTLTPNKIIRNDRKGTIIKWELDALEPFEERLITYRLKSKIVIVGGLNLPSTKIKFEVKGKERKIKSNKCEVSLSI